MIVSLTDQDREHLSRLVANEVRRREEELKNLAVSESGKFSWTQHHAERAADEEYTYWKSLLARLRNEE
jgi:acyl-CoA reductase-like NAD-dependent aldehyde dehydrogenase